MSSGLFSCCLVCWFRPDLHRRRGRAYSWRHPPQRHARAWFSMAFSLRSNLFTESPGRTAGFFRATKHSAARCGLSRCEISFHGISYNFAWRTPPTPSASFPASHSKPHCPAILRSAKPSINRTFYSVHACAVCFMACQYNLRIYRKT